MLLTVERQRLGSVALLRCKGRIVYGPESAALEGAFSAAATEHGEFDFVLDLAETSHIDSSGIGLLVRLARRAKALGGDLKICGASAHVITLLRATGVASLFDMKKDCDAAMAAFHDAPTPLPQAKVPDAGCAVVLDGSRDLCAFLRSALAQRGYQAFSFEHAADAKIMAKTRRARVIVIGPNAQARDEVGRAFTQMLPEAAIVELPAEFATMDPVAAQQALVERLPRKE